MNNKNRVEFASALYLSLERKCDGILAQSKWNPDSRFLRFSPNFCWNNRFTPTSSIKDIFTNTDLKPKERLMLFIRVSLWLTGQVAFNIKKKLTSNILVTVLITFHSWGLHSKDKISLFFVVLCSFYTAVCSYRIFYNYPPQNRPFIMKGNQWPDFTEVMFGIGINSWKAFTMNVKQDLSQIPNSQPTTFTIWCNM